MIAMQLIGEYGNFLGYCSAASLADVHRGPIWLSESFRKVGQAKTLLLTYDSNAICGAESMPTLTVIFAGERRHGCKGSRHYLALMPLSYTHVLLLSSRYLLLAGKGSTAVRMCTDCGSATCLKLVL